MAEKWFISDTHFFHENIIQYCARPFKDAQFMNEYMIDQWNKCVHPSDKVYHLGDVACGYGGDDKKLGDLLSRLNGKKRLVLGNHDNAKSVALQKYFEKIELWCGQKEWGFTCSHIPLPLNHLRGGAHMTCNVHGHIHNALEEDPHYINMCVEHRLYAPTHLDQILKEVKKAG